MTDLDLGLFPLRPEPGEPKPPRRRRSRKRWIRDAFALVLTVVLIGVLVHIVTIGKNQIVDNFSSTRDYTGPGLTAPEIVQVTDKSTLHQVGLALVKAHVVRSAGAFTKAWGEGTTLTKVAPGYYQLKEHMSAAAAVTLLLSPTSKLHTRVTLPEGTPLTKSLALIAKGTSLLPADLAKAAGNPAAIDLPAWAKPTDLEGFLYPLTYQFDPRADAVAAMQQMVAAFSDEAFALDLQDSKDKVHHTPYEVLTIASIIEKEAGTKADYPRVARVIYNRLAKGMKLQLDSTINYVLPERKGHLSQADLQVASPYNTYLHVGLPPTPIDSPGAESLKAALAPSDGNWTFFVTVDKQGDANFTNNYQQFLAWKAQAKAAGVIQ
ncbi:endolytic transglycosylase MltG [Acidothermaceae bacterium B102]|nr:endolytic transglycosylase MltG [Acidothermaceae bacterium B102]